MKRFGPVCIVMLLLACGNSGKVVQCTASNNYCVDGGPTPADAGPIDAGGSDAGACAECPALFSTFAAGASYAGTAQAGGAFTHVGIMGEPTPAPAGGGVVQSGGQYQNQAGFNASNPP